MKESVDEAIDPALATPASNADQSAIHHHLRDLQFLGCTNSASRTKHVKNSWSIYFLPDYLDLQTIKLIKIRERKNDFAKLLKIFSI